MKNTPKKKFCHFGVTEIRYLQSSNAKKCKKRFLKLTENPYFCVCYGGNEHQKGRNVNSGC